MHSKVALLGLTLLCAVSLALAQGKTTLTGVISDEHCGTKHSTASDAASQCVTKCVSGGAKYVLVAGGKTYKLDPQDKFASYAGKSVKVTGTVSGDAMTAESVEEASQQ